jgi:four helix bundle protein
MNTKFDLEERLIRFAANIIQIATALPSTFAGNHLANQLVRSGTSPALNYGEAQGAESRNDFIHKLKIALKELRETHCCLRIIQKQNWLKDEKLIEVIDENSQLIAILVKSIETAKSNNINRKPTN